jgi:hypothetical protein
MKVGFQKQNREMNMLFNKNQPHLGRIIEPPNEKEIRDTPTFWNTPIEVAWHNGGDLTRKALEAMSIKYDRKKTLLCSRIQMIPAGYLPVRPGWHTDGNLLFKDETKQLYINLDGQKIERSTTFHMITTGNACLAEFIINPIWLEIPGLIKGFKQLQDQIKLQPQEFLQLAKIPPCTVIEFDWWNIHRPTICLKDHWRFWVRVAESDFIDENSPQPNHNYKPILP